MAKQQQQSSTSSKSTAVVKHKPTPVAEAPKNRVKLSPNGAAAGFEAADSSAYAIPFLGVLQKGSPQVDETAGGIIIPGAKAGMIFNTVTQKLYDGKKGVEVIPCFYSRTFLRWGARGTDGAGFKGPLTEVQVNDMIERKQLINVDNALFVPDDKGNVNPKKSDTVRDTRHLFCLVVDDKTNTASEALISLTSTQIKKIRGLMPALRARTVQLDNKNERRPMPMWLNRVRVTSVPESNDKGSWYGIQFTLLEDPLPYEAVEDGDGLFIDSVSPIVAQASALWAVAKAGETKVNYESAPSVGAGDDDSSDPDRV